MSSLGDQTCRLKMSVGTEKSPKTWGSRISFLTTKRAIAALSLLITVAIVLIALAATHTIGGNGSSGSKQADSSSGSSNNGTGSSPSPSASPLMVSSSATALPAQTPTTSTATPSATAGAYAGSIDDGTPLRIMCLGASIVKGETSPGTIGFRKVLRDDLVGFGVPVNMVGSVRLGDMVDNDLEAYGGNLITQIHDHAKNIVPETLPNVFVINIGTNNILQNIDIDKAGEQMKDFIDYLLETSPRSFVIMSTLLTNQVPNLEPDVLDINSQYRDLMSTFGKEGKAVVLAELHPSEGGGDEIPQVADIGPDGSHPLVSGYEKMGHIFSKAVQEADAQGFIRVAVDNGIADDGEAERSGESAKLRRRR
ncbi:SGNH hydrolase-type esterase domain-containing protein [Xylariales sp. AK1849]|nr:SGNH hydrolase-type esterase domain-containing protein [Xylariales sp. AK1849]